MKTASGGRGVRFISPVLGALVPKQAVAAKYGSLFVDNITTLEEYCATVEPVMLEQLFGSRVRAGLIGWVFTHPGEPCSVRQVAGALGVDPTQASRELSRLQAMGIVRMHRQGRQKFFEQDPACSIRAELEGMILKTVGAAGLIRAALEKIAGVESAFLYGSFAKGTAGAGSDVDLMIVGDVKLPRFRGRVRGLIPNGKSIPSFEL